MLLLLCVGMLCVSGFESANNSETNSSKCFGNEGWLRLESLGGMHSFLDVSAFC